MIAKFIKNPITLKRLRRFKQVKRAYISWWILVSLYFISLCSELICNNVPLYVRFEGKSFFPIFKYYPEDIFLKNGKYTRPDYKKINESQIFAGNSNNYMIFPIIPFGPYESINPSSIIIPDTVFLILNPLPMLGTINIDKNYVIRQSVSFDIFMDSKPLTDTIITEIYPFPDELKNAIQMRFDNKEAPSAIFRLKSVNGRAVMISLSTYTPRKNPPETVRLTFRDPEDQTVSKIKIGFAASLTPIKGDLQFWNQLSENEQEQLTDMVKARLSKHVEPFQITLNKRIYSVSAIKEEVRFPYKPVGIHLMGIDSAGRDVLTRILYGLRTSLTFGLLLVVCSYALGILAGAVQGYFGGIIDITGQRLIEIWSALPFLYIMILMGSVYGRSFSLLLFCYGIFHWIGISYYIRAEFLRLRKQPFVEAAKCMGLSSWKIIIKHILPNALVPVITFFPFSLVGAIGSLAALDYLGFGLPSPTPSWGELLFQAQQYRWAWWLILYPSLALFIVMLFGVFIGEGIRNAYDPKQFAKLE